VASVICSTCGPSCEQLLTAVGTGAGSFIISGGGGGGLGIILSLFCLCPPSHHLLLLSLSFPFLLLSLSLLSPSLLSPFLLFVLPCCHPSPRCPHPHFFLFPPHEQLPMAVVGGNVVVAVIVVPCNSSCICKDLQLRASSSTGAEDIGAVRGHYQ
jgi:hypothetical protein